MKKEESDLSFPEKQSLKKKGQFLSFSMNIFSWDQCHGWGKMCTKTVVVF